VLRPVLDNYTLSNYFSLILYSHEEKSRNKDIAYFAIHRGNAVVSCGQMTKLAVKRQSEPLLVSRKWGYNIGIQIIWKGACIWKK
jgi:hypothetical protein